MGVGPPRPDERAKIGGAVQPSPEELVSPKDAFDADETYPCAPYQLGVRTAKLRGYTCR
jgi:hypothetical protein